MQLIIIQTSPPEGTNKDSKKIEIAKEPTD